MSTPAAPAKRHWIETFVGHNGLKPKAFGAPAPVAAEGPGVLIVVDGALTVSAALTDAAGERLRAEPVATLDRTDIFSDPAPLPSACFSAGGAALNSLAKFCEYLSRT
jgi:hypothetical protein